MSKKVFILTGFLGAGKTSFLNYLMRNRKNKRYAVIENEVGQIGIDADLLLKEQSELISINEGCICCSMSNGLYDALSVLFDKREEYDEIFIECTGIADPAAVAEPFLSQPEISKFFDLQKIITLVDAENFEAQSAAAPEVLRQIAFSDVMLLNKSDAVAPEQVEKISRILNGLFPMTKLVIGQKNFYPLEEIFSENIPPFSKSEKTQLSEAQSEFRHGDIQSISLRYEQLFDAKYLINRLQQYVFFQAQDLLRFKAIVACRDEENFIILQSVMKKLNLEIGEERGDNRESRFVFIGKNLEKGALVKMLNPCLDRPRIEF
jgi:G3E family GTPase